MMFTLRLYSAPPTVIIRVPGRVNIIGEHIDYCGYAVHPMAIDQDMLVAARRDTGSGEDKLTLRNLDPKYPEHTVTNLPWNLLE